MKTEAEVGVITATSQKMAKIAGSYWKLGRRQKEFFPRAIRREHGPADTVISSF